MEFFVYGTLTDPGRADALLDDYAYRGSAFLRGLHVASGEYPTLAPGGESSGRVLATTAVDALDEYEGVASGLYVRVGVPRAGDGDPVQVYVGDPARLGVDAAWPGDGPLRERVERYVAENDVAVAVDG